MILKSSVNPQGVKPEILLALMVAQAVYRAHGFDLTVTSLLDGNHMKKSLHYKGLAVDIRTRDLPGGYKGWRAKQIREDIARNLGELYDVILEDTHIHIEFDPR